MPNTISNLPLKKQLPILMQKIQNILKKEYGINKKYQHALDEFHAMLKISVKKSYKRQDVELMVCQHLISGHIFSLLFQKKDILNSNPLYKNIEKLLSFSDNIKEKTNSELQELEALIQEEMKGMKDFMQRQQFMNGIYLLMRNTN